MVKDLCFEIIETGLNNCKFCSSNSKYITLGFCLAEDIIIILGLFVLSFVIFKRINIKNQ